MKLRMGKHKAQGIEGVQETLIPHLTPPFSLFCVLKLLEEIF